MRITELVLLASWSREMLDWMATLSNHPALLAQAALVSLAFLLALLTVIATWEIPPAKTLPSRPQPSKDEKGGAEPNASEPTDGGGSLPAIFQSNFAKTVLSGLGGLVAISLVDESFWRGAGVVSRPHYLFLFITFFLAILLSSALFQGIVEALRSRVVLTRRPLARNRTADGFFLYWGRRAWKWALSWRSGGLIFLDTVFNVVQGRNQLQTAGFGKAILNLHLSQVWAADRIRKEVDDAVLRTLWKPEVAARWRELGADPPEDEDIRASISVLSEDGLSVSYLSREEGSLGKPFGQHSIAWVSIVGGEARWLRKSPTRQEEPWNEIYKDDATLFKNDDRRLPGDRELKLKPYLEGRKAQDYEGFIVLPVPWNLRGDEQDRQRAGLHVSFRDGRYMDALWDHLEAEGRPNYDDWRGLLDCHAPGRNGGNEPAVRPLGLLETLLSEAERLAAADKPATETHPRNGSRLLIRDPELAAVLRESVDVLGELLRFFNPRIYEEQLLPQLKAA